MIIDLSVVLDNDTVTYPTDPDVSVTRVVHTYKDGCNVSALEMGTHSGTHVDLPMHYFDEGLDAASATLDLFCGECFTIEEPYSLGQGIEIDHLDLSGIKQGDILIIRTGWEETAGSKAFFEQFPYFSESCAKKLVELGVKAVGTDLPSVDGPSTGGAAHNIILSKGIMIIEALVNLKPLVGKRCYISAVPLKIRNGDGSPVRAYAIL